MRGLAFLFLIIVFAGAAGCRGEPPSTGGGGGAIGIGGSVARGGTDSSAGGSGGLASGGGGGEGGGGGQSANEWHPCDENEAGEPCAWKEIVFSPPAKYRLFTGDPAVVDFPKVEWEACGEGCHFTTLGDFGRVTGDVAVSIYTDAETGVARAAAAVTHVMDTERQERYRRIIRLDDGELIGVMMGVRVTGTVSMSKIWDSALVVLHGGEGVVISMFDPSASSWDTKLPWDESQYRYQWCRDFDLDVSPPVYLFACNRGLEMMAGEGSTGVRTIPDSERSVIGAGNHGLAVWAQLVDGSGGEGEDSRIRGWSPGEEPKELGGVPGRVFGLAVASGHIAGYTAVVPPFDNREGRFFTISRDSGTQRIGPLTPLIGLGEIAANDSFVSATVGVRTESGSEKPAILLSRLSDWETRVLQLEDGTSSDWGIIAIDDEHVYFPIRHSRPGEHGFYRLYRYRLDGFESFGQPFPIERGKSQAPEP